ncbi:MAG: hypothetical protein KatS3mg025_0279 [Bacteroidia bacterium]|nr:MAG: hypothetical protein KatS3mg025_0279 [Bacteroidia bacterium]
MRALLRFGLGAFGVLWWESWRTPPEPVYAAIVVEAACSAAWQKVLPYTEAFWQKGVHVGLIAAKPTRAFWAIPPTQDRALFQALFMALQDNLPAATAQPPSATLVWGQLRPWRTQLYHVVWIGHFESPLSAAAQAYSTWLPACGEMPPFQASSPPIPLPPEDLPTRPVPAWVGYALAFFLCGGILLGMEIPFYFLRKHLALRQAQNILR